MKMSFRVAVHLLVVSISSLLAQSGEWINFDSRNRGLTGGFWTLAVDTNGNKWTSAFDSGLIQFDGENWQNYATENSDIPGNYVEKIYVDAANVLWMIAGNEVVSFHEEEWMVYPLPDTSDGIHPSPHCMVVNGDELWIGTGRLGLFRYMNGSWATFNTTNSNIPSNNITAVAVDSVGDIWVGTSEGQIGKLTNSIWTVFDTTNSPLNDEKITSITVSPENELWVTQQWSNQVLEHVNQTWIVHLPLESDLDEVQDLTIDNSGTVWICSFFQLRRFDGLSWETIELNNQGSLYFFNSLAADSHDNIWLSTDYGLVQFDGVSATQYLPPPLRQLPDERVYALAQDSQNDRVWAGTRNGLAVFHGTESTIYDSTNSDLPGNYVLSLAVDQNQTVWVGTYQSGLAAFDGTTWTIYDTTNSDIPGNDIQSLVVDEQNRIWVGTKCAGLAMYGGLDWMIFDTTNSNFPANYITALEIDGSGDLWAGTYDNGVAEYDGETWIHYNTDNSDLPGNHILSLHSNGDDSIWIGTTYGLAAFDHFTWTVYTWANSGLPANQVYAIETDWEGNYWFGTQGSAISGGLVRFDGAVWTRFSTDNSGLPHNFVHALTSDNQGNMWIGTAGGGLSVYQPGGVQLSIEQEESVTPTEMRLDQNFPNPFNPTTTIRYRLPVSGHVDLHVYDITGREVIQLVDRYQTQGNHVIRFDGSELASGVYFYVLKSNGWIKSKKMLLAK